MENSLRLVESTNMEERGIGRTMEKKGQLYLQTFDRGGLATLTPHCSGLTAHCYRSHRRTILRSKTSGFTVQIRNSKTETNLGKAHICISLPFLLNCFTKNKQVAIWK